MLIFRVVAISNFRIGYLRPTLLCISYYLKTSLKMHPCLFFRYFEWYFIFSWLSFVVFKQNYDSYFSYKSENFNLKFFKKLTRFQTLREIFCKPKTPLKDCLFRCIILNWFFENTIFVLFSYRIKHMQIKKIYFWQTSERVLFLKRY